MGGKAWVVVMGRDCCCRAGGLQARPPQISAPSYSRCHWCGSRWLLSITAFSGAARDRYQLLPEMGLF